MRKEVLSISLIAWSNDLFVYCGELTHGQTRHEVAVPTLFHSVHSVIDSQNPSKVIDKQSGGLGAPQVVSSYGAILQQLRTRPRPEPDSDDLHPLAQRSVPA